MADIDPSSTGRTHLSEPVLAGAVSFLLALVGTLLVAVIYTGAGGRRGDLAAMVERMMVGALGLAVVGAVCGLLGGLRAAKTAAFLGGLAGTAVTLFAFPDWVRDSVGDRTYLPLGTFSVAFLLGAGVGAGILRGRGDDGEPRAIYFG